MKIAPRKSINWHDGSFLKRFLDTIRIPKIATKQIINQRCATSPQPMIFNVRRLKEEIEKEKKNSFGNFYFPLDSPLEIAKRLYGILTLNGNIFGGAT